LSASTSCNRRAVELLARIRCGEKPPLAQVKALGEECTGEFFRVVVESLADSFDPAEARIYERLMQAWIPPLARIEPRIPDRVQAVYVLSRVTLGADIKVVSPMLTAMRQRFPNARIVFAGSRKSAELFERRRGIDFMQADYPRSGSMRDRFAFAEELRARIDTPHRIVLDPDSRMTQLGLIAVCEPERYFHFPSRTAGGESDANLTDLVRTWLLRKFGVSGPTWIDPTRVEMDSTRPIAAVSLGVGENESKRLGLDFESKLIGALRNRFRTIWIDRGVGGAEAARVSAAAEAAGATGRMRFWEGSFAGFASIVAQSDFYLGYDSAGQHAAAAGETSLVTIFKGAPSERFRQRWAPRTKRAHIIDADALTPEQCLDALITILPGHL
jgi:ADP-heptose:LPS heptosyltransferase